MNAGWTLSSISFPFLIPAANSLILYPNSFAYSISSFDIFVIPSFGMSLRWILCPKAKVDSIDSLYAASSPSTSEEGSASAKPRACASFKACL